MGDEAPLKKQAPAKSSAFAKASHGAEEGSFKAGLGRFLESTFVELMILLLVVGDIVCLGIEHGIDSHHFCIHGHVVPVAPTELGELGEKWREENPLPEHHGEHGHEHGKEHGAEHSAEHGEEHGAEHGEEHGAEHGEEHGAEHGEEHGAEHGEEHAEHGATQAMTIILSKHRTLHHLRAAQSAESAPTVPPEVAADTFGGQVVEDAAPVQGSQEQASMKASEDSTGRLHSLLSATESSWQSADADGRQRWVAATGDVALGVSGVEGELLGGFHSLRRWTNHGSSTPQPLALLSASDKPEAQVMTSSGYSVSNVFNKMDETLTEVLDDPSIFLQTGSVVNQPWQYHVVRKTQTEHGHGHPEEALVCETKHGPHAHELEHICHTLSIAILCIFLLELLLKMFVNFHHFWTNPFEVLDFFVVTLSIIVDVIILPAVKSAEGKDTATTALYLLLVCRFWRVVRIAHGFFEMGHKEYEKQEKMFERIAQLEKAYLDETGKPAPASEEHAEHEPLARQELA